MTEPAKPYDYEGALRFPLIPYAHQTAWRYMFDWAVAGEALNGVPGELVLEFGAGPSYASEFFNRLGYYTVALDINSEILSFAQKRMTVDRRIEPQRTNFVAGDGQRLPFADATFDSVICLHALHHIPDYTAALAEIRRILKAGGRAAFAEPGSRHAESPEAQQAMERFGVLEKNVVLKEIYQIARRVGFDRMLLKPYVYPSLVQLDYRELEAYCHNRSYSPFTRQDEIAHFLQNGRGIFILEVPGEKPVTSVRPNSLRAEINLCRLPASLNPGQQIPVEATVRNCGDTLWLSTPRQFGGYVTFGIRLCLPNGRLLSETLGRSLISHDVPPGETVLVRTSIEVPETLAPGQYVLRFDMVDEQVAWFEQFGSKVIEHRFCLTNGVEAGSQGPADGPSTPQAATVSSAVPGSEAEYMSREQKNSVENPRGEAETAPAAALSERTWHRELQHRLAQEWHVEEQPLRSNVPLVGPLIAAFRNAWNSVASKWYVRQLFDQQQRYNHLLCQVISLQQEQIQRQGRLLDDRERSISALAEQTARLEIRLFEIQDELTKRDESRSGASR